MIPDHIVAGLRRPKIDVHAHVWGGPDPDRESDHLVACARRVGITELWCSRPIPGGRIAAMEEVRRCNDVVLRAMQRHPDIIRGLCFVIPGYYREAVAEVERCLDAGMTGIKLYNQYKIDDPAVRPIIELAVERRVPILVHAAYLSPPFDKDQPRTSNGADFARASQRHPEAVFIHGHIGGGGDWEWTLRALRDASPRVYVDTSGSNLDDGQVEYAVAELGAERVLFATDNMIEGGVGKVLGSTLSDEEKERVFFGNAAAILAMQGKSPLALQGAGPSHEDVTADAL